MAVRGSVTLLFILLSGIVHANDLVTSPLPETAEPSTIKLSSVMQTTTAPPTTSEHSSATTHAGVTSEAPDVNQSKMTSYATGSQAITQAPTTTTTQAPTTHHNTTTTTKPPTTTHHNTTNSTTDAPTTPHSNATTAPTAAPTVTPTTPPVPNPTPGNYSVKSDNVTVCLLAKMGLQFSFKNGNDRIQTLNLDPSVTEVSGTCGGGGNDSSLVLKSKEITVQFVFTNVSDKFHLHSLNFSVFGNGSVFSDSNYNLSLWEATVGSSYMCKKEQRYNITDKLTVNTFQLQVQPFAVQKNMFSTAEDCKADEPDNFIVPIAVGVALAVLIIIVLLAYVIGRKRSQTSGYEQFDSQ